MGLNAYAHSVLANVNAVWAAQAPPVALPSLQYVAPGPFDTVSADCEQVVVSVDAVNRGAPGEPLGVYVRLGEWSATVTVAVWRGCMPSSVSVAAPVAADQNAASAITHGDLDIMWRNVEQILGVTPCQHHGVLIAELLPIESVVGGAKLTVAVDLLSV